MTTHVQVDKRSGLFFVTFTCFRHFHLIEDSGAYPAFYKWFEYLKSIEVALICYCIMPNHFHGILGLKESSRSVNVILSNGKRFIAYDIIKRLKANRRKSRLDRLSDFRTEIEVLNRQKHKVFTTSSDIVRLKDVTHFENVFSYIHKNPVNGKWKLVVDWRRFKYSSAGFYELGKSDEYVVSYEEWVRRCDCGF